MSGDSFLLDTNTVLYLLRGDEALALLLQDKQVFISLITEMELLSWQGLQDAASLKKVRAALSEFTIIGIENDIKERTIELRKKKKLKLPDAIILATAHYLNVPLITADKALAYDENGTVILYKNIR